MEEFLEVSLREVRGNTIKSLGENFKEIPEEIKEGIPGGTPYGLPGNIREGISEEFP